MGNVIVFSQQTNSFRHNKVGQQQKHDRHGTLYLQPSASSLSLSRWLSTASAKCKLKCGLVWHAACGMARSLAERNVCDFSWQGYNIITPRFWLMRLLAAAAAAASFHLKPTISFSYGRAQKKLPLNRVQPRALISFFFRFLSANICFSI